MTLLNKHSARNRTANAHAASPAAVLQTIQASLMPSAAHSIGAQSIPDGSRRGFWSLFDRNARTHRDVMEVIRDVGIETLEGMTASTVIATDFVANTLDAERTMEQIIREHEDSSMALNAAPVYVQLGRQMLMDHTPAIAHAGLARIRRKIEQR